MNDLTDDQMLAHLRKYDSVLGRLAEEVTCDDESITVGGHRIPATSVDDPEELPWGELGADVVLKCTGRFTDASGAHEHIDAGATKVVISAAGKGVDLTVVLGINEGDYDPARHDVLSMASCTTNCLAPMAKVLDEEFGIVSGLMTTVHAYTADQRLQDGPHKDMRRARAAGLNVVPTKTGAAKAISQVLPQFEGKLDGFAFRGPVPTGSVTDLTVRLEREATAEEVNTAFRRSHRVPCSRRYRPSCHHRRSGKA